MAKPTTVGQTITTRWDSLLVRYNPANPEQNRDATGDIFDETTGFIGFVVIVCGLYCWLKWILGSEKAMAPAPINESPCSQSEKSH